MSSIFYLGIFLLSAGTLIYEVVLTRLLSVVTWYYLAFVSVSMAMFGLTVGALVVQLLPRYFPESKALTRIAQSAFLAAFVTPFALMTMLAVPVMVTGVVESWYSFLLLSAVIATPFVFAGVGISLSITYPHCPIGRVYSVDLAGAAVGCLGSLALLHRMDASSAVLAAAAIMFASSSLFFLAASDRKRAIRTSYWAIAVALLAVLNASTPYGIQPVWSKGMLDSRSNMLTEVWNPISRIRASNIRHEIPQMWGPSPHSPSTEMDEISLDIDSDAETPVLRYEPNPSKLDFLRYDVTSLAAQLRTGGAAAIIGLGGGRDALNCWVNGFHRIVGIEVNEGIINLTTKRFVDFSGFSKIPGLEVHHDEGRSYLTRTNERFDLIQASMVDTWAASAGGAMTLSENSLYTVDGWKVFYTHLTPGGLITFSRWYSDSESTQIYRLFAVAWATLLEEGVSRPADYLAVVRSGPVATLILSNQPLSEKDLSNIKSTSATMGFELLYLPGLVPQSDALRKIVAMKSPAEMRHLRSARFVDYSPVYDSAPYFFNAVHLADLPGFLIHRHDEAEGNVLAILFIVLFMGAAAVLVLLAIVIPAMLRRKQVANHIPYQGLVYFAAIGFGFVLVEMAMMQQLTILLGQPIYSFSAVIAALILSSGFGSLTSEKMKLQSSLEGRLPALAVVVALAVYYAIALRVIHWAIAGALPLRVSVAVLLVIPSGFLMGFCFPTGLRVLRLRGQNEMLPWMWAVNGAAGTLGTFVAIIVSIDASIATCVVAGAICYLLAGAVMPSSTWTPPIAGATVS